jgi:hypothetical protein
VRNIFSAIRNIIPDSIFYNRALIPLRLIYGETIKNKKRTHLRFDVHIADHCNINCKSCEHFSPLAPKSFIDIKKYENDCNRIAELINEGGGKIVQMLARGLCKIF